MSTATVTENTVTLEPVTRDDFADEPVRTPAGPERARVYRSNPAARRQTV